MVYFELLYVEKKNSPLAEYRAQCVTIIGMMVRWINIMKWPERTVSYIGLRDETILANDRIYYSIIDVQVRGEGSELTEWPKYILFDYKFLINNFIIRHINIMYLY